MSVIRSEDLAEDLFVPGQLKTVEINLDENLDQILDEEKNVEQHYCQKFGNIRKTVLSLRKGDRRC